jgi:6-phosphofructokinase 2
MALIVTITANPAIDLSTSVDSVFPIHKLRCSTLRRDPGGGGINVARVVHRLGGQVTAVYPAGGSMGELLRRLVQREGARGIPTVIGEETREDFTVLEQASGQQYRFVLPGPAMREAEWRGLLDALDEEARGAQFIVASGSLAPGMPDDFYARIARVAGERGCRTVVDSSGAPLAAALQERIYMVKPNLRELQELVKQPLAHESDWAAASRALLDRFPVELVALSLGHQGALLTTRHEALRAPALPIRSVSAVGAGDSFLGAMVWSLAQGMRPADALRYGVAAGSAAVLNAGTELCHAEDVHRLLPQVTVTTI